MADETRGPDTPLGPESGNVSEPPVVPILPIAPIAPDTRKNAEPTESPAVADIVKQTMLQLATWQQITERIKTRVRTSKIKPPEEPPEIIP